MNQENIKSTKKYMKLSKSYFCERILSKAEIIMGGIRRHDELPKILVITNETTTFMKALLNR